MEVGLGFTATGAVFLLVGALLFLRANRIENQLVRVHGEVVALAEHSSGDGSVSYAPIVQFSTADGQTIRFTDPLGTNPPTNTVGEKVTVSYDSEDPDGARIAGGRLFLPMLIAAIGAAFVAGGLVVVLVAAARG